MQFFVGQQYGGGLVVIWRMLYGYCWIDGICYFFKKEVGMSKFFVGMMSCQDYVVECM